MALVYRHRRLDNNQVFYIGISRNKRRPYRTDGRNDHWVKIYKKVGFSVDILVDDISIDEAQELEVFLIELYGRIRVNDGCLVNKTNGGEFFEHSEESKEKIRQSKIGDKNPNYGKKQSDETIQNRVKYLAGRIVTQETIGKQKKGAVRSGQSKETVLIDYKSGKEIGVFNSLNDAVRFAGLDIDKSRRASVIASGKGGPRHSVGGFAFKYLNYEKPAKIKTKRENHKSRRLILNTETGVFYNGTNEAQDSWPLKCALYRKLNGSRNNDTPFIYV